MHNGKDAEADIALAYAAAHILSTENHTRLSEAVTTLIEDGNYGGGREAH